MTVRDFLTVFFNKFEKGPIYKDFANLDMDPHNPIGMSNVYLGVRIVQLTNLKICVIIQSSIKVPVL